MPPARLRLIDTTAALEQAGEVPAHGLGADAQQCGSLLAGPGLAAGPQDLELAGGRCRR